jgi:UDP:flavonoid glycosyltransferase YjiC (YdhE family)
MDQGVGTMKVFQTLFATAGNAPPQLAVTRRLLGEGHEVLVLAHEAARRRIEAIGAPMVPFRTVHPDMDPSRPETDPFRDWEVRSPLAALDRLRDAGYLEPIPGAAEESAAAIAGFSPDVVLFDFMLLGAAVAAEAAGVPAVALVHCPYLLPTPGVPPYGLGLRWPRTPLGRAFQAAIRRAGGRAFRPVTVAVNIERTSRGLAPVGDWTDQLLGAARVLVFTAPELDFAARGPLPGAVRHVGPAFEPTDEPWTSPWPRDDQRPLVVVSLSTTYMRQEDLARRVLEALGDLPVRVLLTAGPALDTSGLRPRANTVIVPFVPHRSVLPQASLVITHAGWGTINAALSCGVPVVCIPCGRDQPDGARRVADAGAGLVVPKSASPKRIRAAVAKAIDDRRLREGAARMATALGRQDGAEVAMQEVLAVAAGDRMGAGTGP